MYMRVCDALESRAMASCNTFSYINPMTQADSKTVRTNKIHASMANIGFKNPNVGRYLRISKSTRWLMNVIFPDLPVGPATLLALVCEAKTDIKGPGK